MSVKAYIDGSTVEIFTKLLHSAYTSLYKHVCIFSKINVNENPVPTCPHAETPFSQSISEHHVILILLTQTQFMEGSLSLA